MNSVMLLLAQTAPVVAPAAEGGSTMDTIIKAVMGLAMTAITMFLLPFLKRKSAAAAAEAVKSNVEGRGVLADRAKAFLFGEAGRIAEKEFPKLAGVWPMSGIPKVDSGWWMTFWEVHDAVNGIPYTKDYGDHWTHVMNINGFDCENYVLRKRWILHTIHDVPLMHLRPLIGNQIAGERQMHMVLCVDDGESKMVYDSLTSKTHPWWRCQYRWQWILGDGDHWHGVHDTRMI